jgi:hypothetical protein
MTTGKKIKRWTREFTEEMLTKFIEDIVERPYFKLQAWEKENGLYRSSMRNYCKRYNLMSQYLKARSMQELKKGYGDVEL